MYDTISGHFFVNHGTGVDFLYAYDMNAKDLYSKGTDWTSDKQETIRYFQYSVAPGIYNVQTNYYPDVMATIFVAPYLPVYWTTSEHGLASNVRGVRTIDASSGKLVIGIRTGSPTYTVLPSLSSYKRSGAVVTFIKTA